MDGAEPEEAEQDDDDTVMQEGTEEESAAAARAAAAQRAERQQNGDDPTTTKVEEPKLTAPIVPDEAEAEDEPDPLDAFMLGIGDAMEIETSDSRQEDLSKEEALYGDDEVELVSTEADPDDILAMAAKMKKKKELPSVNHAKMKYDSFRKDFYVEPAELADMTEDEIDDLRLGLDGIKIRVSRFSNLHYIITSNNPAGSRLS